MTVTDWMRERCENAVRIAGTKHGQERKGWLEDASYLLQACEALEQLEIAASNRVNAPIRMYIALRILTAWNNGSAGYSLIVVSTVNKWFEDGMVGPVPWPDSRFFEEWAKDLGYANVDGYVGFRFQVAR